MEAVAQNARPQFVLRTTAAVVLLLRAETGDECLLEAVASGDSAGTFGGGNSGNAK